MKKILSAMWAWPRITPYMKKKSALWCFLFSASTANIESMRFRACGRPLITSYLRHGFRAFASRCVIRILPSAFR